MIPSRSRALLSGDDLELVSQARQLREQFGLMALSYRSHLKGLCAGLLQNESDIEDAVSETLMKAVRMAATYDGQASLKTWLVSIAKNECRMKLREQRGRIKGAISFSQLGSGTLTSDGEIVDFLDNLPAPGPSVEDLALGPMDAECTWARIMQEAAGRWKMADYKLFALRTLAGLRGSEPVMTFSEIAGLLDECPSTLRWRWRDHIDPVLQRALREGRADEVIARESFYSDGSEAPASAIASVIENGETGARAIREYSHAGLIRRARLRPTYRFRSTIPPARPRRGRPARPLARI